MKYMNNMIDQLSEKWGARACLLRSPFKIDVCGAGAERRAGFPLHPYNAEFAAQKLKGGNNRARKGSEHGYGSHPPAEADGTAHSGAVGPTLL
jgi:hypothetical protein